MSTSTVARIKPQYDRQGFRLEIPCLECKQQGWKKQGVMRPRLPYKYNDIWWMRYQCDQNPTHVCIETAQRPSVNDRTGWDRWDTAKEPEPKPVIVTELVDDDDPWKGL